VGRLILNRPKALNALTADMIRALAAGLSAWRDDPSVHAVVIEGTGERAFCAGGDIRAIRDLALAGEHRQIAAFFADEYALNQVIADYPKPYVAFIDGLCLGGGIGVSVHGRFRVATEAAVFAMPETAIGMFPDIGASYFLPRLPGQLGMYLGLLGTRVHGADAVAAGLATHFVPRAKLADLTAALAADGVAALAAFAEPPAAPGWAPHRARIDHCFSADTVTELLRRLHDDASDWAHSTLAELHKMSPSAVLWSHKIIRLGAARTLRECLAAELALTRHVTAHHDFAEGVRAMVIDKDRQPRWQPATLGAVDPSEIEALFGRGD
jgi:enoyl-CoA hydratase